MARVTELRTHSSHWGAFTVRRHGKGLIVRPPAEDPDPSAILGNIAAAPRHATRVARPAVRAGYLEHGPGSTSQRGREPFVEVAWDEALELIASELRRVRDTHGNDAIFAGSYGWGSAGRYHAAAPHLQRFLAGIGGFVASRNSYSSAAAETLLPHVLGNVRTLMSDGVTWDEIVAHTDTLVAFGGMPHRTQAVAHGGVARHVARAALTDAVARGAHLVLVSPLRDDLADAQWLAPRPGTDAAVMLAIAHTLLVENLYDKAFVERCCVGFEEFAAHLRGEDDGVEKTAGWAASICELPAETILALARRMASGRTLINVSHSLQRAEHGEQPVWLGVVLAAMLGQIGAPGGGFMYALGIMAHGGRPPLAASLGSLPRLPNPVQRFIPVARVSDMLLSPGGRCDYDGRELVYPDIRIVQWAGGNPFHHHQDLGRLRRGWGRPETVIVHEPFWTATARHADIVLPSTITLERDDLGASANDPKLIAMKQAVAPFGEARDDVAVFTELAEAFGTRAQFTEGRTPAEWLRHLYDQLRAKLADGGHRAPGFDEFWEAGELELPVRSSGRWLSAFAREPDAHPLTTPTGKIEITSATIAGFGYPDCPGRPTWLAGEEWLGAPRACQFPLQLLSNQPATRLHSQLDFGAVSAASKIAGREPVRLHPRDAAQRGIADGDVVRLFNDRGACLAGAVLSDALRPGVVQLATGAWYDPDDELGLCRHGNPNALTRDVGTSRLAQGSTGQLVLVEVERFRGTPPPVRTHEPPQLTKQRG
jgi:biotin/methionine sulfoxide reductase